jgi:hypothetical protein
MPCLTTPLVLLHGDRCGPERVVNLGGGLGYRRPVQGLASGADLQIIARPVQVVVHLPVMEGLSACSVLLESCGLNAIHAIRQICHILSTALGSQSLGKPVPFQMIVFRSPAQYKVYPLWLEKKVVSTL